MSTWQDFLHVVTDPAHIGAELVFNIVFDLLVMAVGWRLLIKPYFDRYFHKTVDEVHAEIDAEHGYTHPQITPGQGHVSVIPRTEYVPYIESEDDTPVSPV